ncbi:MAG: hypothetical protein ACYC1L_10275 [Alphaproteobacteria bacterium]
MRKYLAAAAVLAFLTSPAFAMQCPANMKAIDGAMAKNPQLSSTDAAAVKQSRAEGEALHKAGKHQESVDTLAKAKKILNVQ